MLPRFVKLSFYIYPQSLTVISFIITKFMSVCACVCVCVWGGGGGEQSSPSPRPAKSRKGVCHDSACQRKMTCSYYGR